MKGWSNWSYGAFVTRRLHSLTGIVPLGLFLSLHLLGITQPTGGTSSIGASSDGASAIGTSSIWGFLSCGGAPPLLSATAWTLLLVALLGHGSYGLLIASRPRYCGVARPHHPGYRLYRLQRVSGILLLAFVTVHLLQARIAGTGTGTAWWLADKLQILGDPCSFWFYAAGTLAAAGHLSIGIATFGMTWGLTTSPSSRRWAQLAAVAVFSVLSVAGITGIFGVREW
ncbi:hypothetical protein ACFL59_13015 [Planctomycetota bacterium]